MNAAHLHLMVNHLPLFAALFAGVLIAAGMMRKQVALTNAGLMIAVVAGLGAFAAARTGEGAEEIVSELAAVSEGAIEPHEEAAEAAMFAAMGLGALALIALASPARMAKARRAASIGALIMAVVTFGMVARTANLGGAIRHPEIGAPASGTVEGHDSEDWEPRVDH
jgi:hypothetical protein